MPETSLARVLVVDDDSSVRALVRSSLLHIGFADVTECVNGEEALKEFIERPAQLVISDLRMPKLDGLGLLRAIRERSSAASTLFVFLTSRRELSIVKEAMDLRADAYLVKPFTFGGLKEKIGAIVEPFHPAARKWLVP